MSFVINIGDGKTSSNSRQHKGKSLIAFPSDYCIVDLETTGLSPAWDDIIEIGAIRYSSGRETVRFQSLVQPDPSDDGTFISDFVSKLTGITNEMLSTAPAPANVLREFDSFLGDSLVVGYNVNFDVNFLCDNYERYLGKPFPNNFVDVMRLSRKLHPELSHHRLSDMMSLYGIVPDREHRSLSDCSSTFACYEKLLSEALQKYGSEENFSRAFKRTYAKASARARDIVVNVDAPDPDSPFYQRNIVVTGKLEKFTRAEVIQLIASIGGINEDTVTKKTNFLILGNNDYCSTIRGGKSAKQKKAEAYKLKGLEIDIIPETVFYDMITDYLNE